MKNSESSGESTDSEDEPPRVKEWGYSVVVIVADPDLFHFRLPVPAI